MPNVYKIETFSGENAERIADTIRQAGSHSIIRGWAILTDHVFNTTDTKKIFPLVSRTTDDLTEDDIYVWMQSLALPKAA
ncbi:hypothetical protein DI392_00895 [Vibrio albus]|uniref:Uncharacterized protein n=1 Tax=Vibrio albus TaxID=2200953 RepID=A0A2U3BDL9_9VIBR|nr:hypothetical protein [Vibrio albus]PWI34870.1 hypothetical protein DI392_00895 [Vibrio albus]